MKKDNQNNDQSISNDIDKMKVLGLQELTEVAGGAAAWSTDSVNCGTVGSDEWSTLSRGCRSIIVIRA